MPRVRERGKTFCDYIGETKRNTITRWSEHDTPTKGSELARNLKKHFNCFFLCHASKQTDIRKNLEALFTALVKPSISEQKNFERLILFRNGTTKFLIVQRNK